jgi:glycosyltransferase involved in cell wall biosynthesis
MIDVGYPQPDQDSGSIDQINFIRIFQSLQFDIYFIAVAHFRSVSPHRDALVAMGVTCVHIPEYKSIENFIEEKADALDLFFLSRVHFGGRYIEYIKRVCPHSKVIFNTVDLHYIREGREAFLRLDIEALTQAQKTRSRELELVATADATIVVSLVEEKTLKTAAERGSIHCIPLVRDFAFDRHVGFDARSGIGFIGGFLHQPNVDAIEYFLSEIWKQIQLDLPNVELFVIGSNMSDAWKARSVSGVNFIGYVPELDPWLDRLRLTVAPLRYGAGAKGKVVSSLGHGTPCVASPIAAEGMGLQDGVNITIARFPHEFAAEVVGVYREPERWRHLSEAGLELVRAQNSFERGLDSMRDVLESLDLIKPQPVCTSTEPGSSA